MIKRSFQLLVSTLFAIGFSYPFAYSQTPAPPRDPGQQLRDQQEQQKALEEMKRARAELQGEEAQKSVPTALPPEPKSHTASFLIRTIHVKNVTRFSEKELAEMIQPYENSRFDMARLDHLISTLTNAYIDRGYITTRVYIPAQDIADGSLELEAVEGKIESIVMNQNGFRDRLKTWMAVPLPPDDILKLQYLEQGIDQINRVASADAKMTLDPGIKEGTSRVIITNPAKGAFRSSLSLDNYGADVTGQLRAGLALEVDNLLGFNDTWSLLYQGAQESNAVVAGFSVPFRWWTFSVQGTYSEYLTLVNPYAQLLGQSYTGAAELSRVVFRNTHHKTTLSLALDAKFSDRYLNDAELDPQRLADLCVGISHLWRRPKTVMTFGLSFAHGFDWLDESPDDDQTSSAGDPEPEFNNFSFSVSLITELKSWLTWQSQLQTQYGFEPLQSTEQLYVGDYYSVRGYRNSFVSGDWGGYWRNDFLIKAPKFNSKNIFAKFVDGLTPFVFADGGFAGSHTDGVDESWLVSAGGGVKFQLWRLSGEVYAAFPLIYANEVPVEDHAQIYFSLNLKTW